MLGTDVQMYHFLVQNALVDGNTIIESTSTTKIKEPNYATIIAQLCGGLATGSFYQGSKDIISMLAGSQGDGLACCQSQYKTVAVSRLYHGGSK